MGQKSCVPYYHENAAFKVGLDLIYAMDKLLAGEMVLGWETVRIMKRLKTFWAMLSGII